MGHDEHFLTRIDRLHDDQAAFALSLYRDHEFVKSLLSHLSLAPGEQRIAIALDKNPGGPHVVLARDGGFVTCLGAGMSTGAHLVVERSRLDALLARRSDLRERGEQAKRLAGTSAGALGHLLGRIVTSGDGLSREEFLAIASLQPLMKYRFAADWFQGQRFWAETAPKLMEAVSRRGAGPFEKQLHASWQLTWAMGHSALLTALDSGDVMDAIDAKTPLADGPSPTLVPAQTRLLGTALRSWWLGSRSPRCFVPMYRHRFALATEGNECIDAGIGLLMIGAGHSRLRAEVLRSIRPPRSSVPAGEPAVTPMTQFRAGIFDMATLLFANEDTAPEVVRLAGSDAYYRASAHAATDRPYVYPNPSAVPMDIAAAHLVNLPLETVPLDVDNFLVVLSLATWMARQPADAFYLPRAALDVSRTGYSLQKGLTTLRLSGLQQYFPPPVKPETRRAAPVPGRNDPCSCGSGKKYKRCCAA